MSILITVGGALVGLLAALVVLTPWWRKGGGGSGKVPMGKGAPGAAGGRNWKALAPFAAAFTLGTLCSIATGGLLGQGARRLGQGSNTLGDKLLSVLTGSASPAVSRHSLTMLQPGGAVVLILLLAAVVIWWRGSGRKLKRDMVLGLISGATLGPTAGIAGLAGAMLAPLVNSAGGWIVGLM